MNKIKSIVFRIRYWLMPSELKEGTWLLVGGDASNLNDLWRKSKKPNTWYIPRIEWRKEKKP